jgi:hypothetical protein
MPGHKAGAINAGDDDMRQNQLTVTTTMLNIK